MSRAPLIVLLLLPLFAAPARIEAQAGPEAAPPSPGTSAGQSGPGATEKGANEKGDSLTLSADVAGEVGVSAATPAPTGGIAPPVSPGTANALMVLNGDLQVLASRSSHRYYDAARYLLAGALSATLGVLAWDFPPMPAYFFLYAGAGLAAGAVELFVRPDTHHAAITFQHMPMANESEAAARLHYGEDALRTIALRSRIARILSSSIEIAVGVAVVPVLLASPTGLVIDDSWDYIILISASAAVVSGAIGLIIPSDAELRWRAYSATRQLEGRAASASRAPKPTARFLFSPIRGGAFAGVTGQL